MAKDKKAGNPVFDGKDGLGDLKSHFDKTYGAGAVRFAGDTAIVPVESIPTGILSIDSAIGCGGIPRGRILEIFGPESSGKTTTCLKIVSAFQQAQFNGRNGRVAYIDAEHSLDPQWAHNIGVDIGSMIFNQPDHGEQAYDIIETIAKSGKVELIVLDSIAALVTKDEIEGTLEGNNQIGSQARMNSKAFAKLKGVIASSKCTLICVNQIREKIGVMFGNPETTPGGRALKFYASVRMDIRRTGKFDVGGETVGNTTRVKFIKNKVAPPFTEANFNITFGLPSYPVFGVDPYSSLLEVAKDLKIVTVGGSWLNYGDMRLGNGLAASAAYLASDPNLFQKIYNHVLTGSKECHINRHSMNEETQPILENPQPEDS